MVLPQHDTEALRQAVQILIHPLFLSLHRPDGFLSVRYPV
jgi:hypothetical protein